jgi:hypothetical protein
VAHPQLLLHPQPLPPKPMPLPPQKRSSKMIQIQLLSPQPSLHPQPLPLKIPLPPPQMLSRRMIQIIEQQSLPFDMRLFPHPHPEDKFPIGYLQIFFTPYHMPLLKMCEKKYRG